MELKELTEKTSLLFGIGVASDLPKKIKEKVLQNDFEIYRAFEEMVIDLRVDWLQKIYQYHLADRVEKKQDYTPLSLAKLVSALGACSADDVIDMCAGSGALTIQHWANKSTDARYTLYELDDNVIPLLLFNLAVRNMQATVYQADVLQDKIYHTYSVIRGDKYSTVRMVG